MRRKYVYGVVLAVSLIGLSIFLGLLFFGGPSDREVRFLTACENGDWVTVTSMLRENPGLARCQAGGIGPLHVAAIGGHLKVVQFLLDHGADPLLCNKSGEYAHDWGHEYPEIYQLLLQKFVDAGGRVIKKE